MEILSLVFLALSHGLMRSQNECLADDVAFLI